MTTAKSGQEDELPHYSALRLRPSRGLPKELQAMEASAQFKERSEAMFEQLRTGLRPPTDIPIFTTLIGENGPLTLQLGEHLCRCNMLTVVESKPDQSDADMFGVWATFPRMA